MPESFNGSSQFTPIYKIDFADLGRLFLELKGQGACLSSTDVGVLMKWKTLGYDPQEISQFLIELFNLCNAQKKPFPKNLSSIDLDLKNIKNQWG